MCLGQNDFVDFREILRSDRGDDFIINSEIKPYINRHMNETGG